MQILNEVAVDQSSARKVDTTKAARCTEKEAEGQLKCATNR